jgi:hypothetical protein
MKSQIPFHLTLMATVCLIFSGCATQKRVASAEPPKPSETNIESQTKFGIFLTINPDLAIRPSIVDLAQVKLASSPVISAEDILSYDFSNHSMKLRSEALARIPNPPVHGLPFVVVADGQRIYLGAFWTEVSSIPSSVPTITVNKQRLAKDQPQDIQIIDRAYPTRSFGEGPDPRSDPRIKTALAALHKLK